MIDPDKLISEVGVAGLCEASEQYFRRLPNPTIILGKPYIDLRETPNILYKLGLLLSDLKLGKSMTVLDFGAGTCWLSRILNQLQCITISLDTSMTALKMGEELFNIHPVVGGSLSPPKFLLYNGYQIELEDESVDRIVCFDAFHHVPNQRYVLDEFFRVLKKGGLVGFSEPGRNHSSSAGCQANMKNYKFLERDIRMEDIEKMSKEAGFTDLRIKMVTEDLSCSSLDLTLDEYQEILFRKTLRNNVITHVSDCMQNSTVFYLYKGDFIPDSRTFHGLKHKIESKVKNIRVRAGEKFSFELKIKNVGFSRWLHFNTYDVGITKIGCHLYDGNFNLINFDYDRVFFDHDILPGESISSSISFSMKTAGKYFIEVDLVSEHVCWFGNLNNETITFGVEVEET
jgi:cyclopropane fatty-acyl-phospholipid synthase-like methyltransferase